MKFYMGIDGGGSNVRVAIVSPSKVEAGQSFNENGVNPNIVGFDQAKLSIQATIRDALIKCNLSPDDIAAVGIGIAGAPNNLADTWLREVVGGVLPHTYCVTSSDHEIALTGALGKPEGVLVLSGTGHLIYGATSDGRNATVGGWGFMIGDEGSGFWIGKQALQAVSRAFDGRGKPTMLESAIYAHMQIDSGWGILDWVYRDLSPRRIAQLVPIVFDCAAQGDTIASNIIEEAAQELCLAAQTVMRRLAIEHPPFAFTGGLLANDTPLSQRLAQLLDLPKRPEALYSPVIGAAILAQQGHSHA